MDKRQTPPEDPVIHALRIGLWHARFLHVCGRWLEAHQVLGQDAIGADFNSLTHMISPDLLVRFIEFLRRLPELKEVLSSAGTAAKTLAKEQAAARSAEENALGKIKSQLAAFRVN